MSERAEFDAGATFAERRPWRVVGAAVCVVLGIMYVLGVVALDIDKNPALAILYWFLMMILVAWACALAIKDIRHTRRLARDQRRDSATH